jgi:hypothetical protein
MVGFLKIPEFQASGLSPDSKFYKGEATKSYNQAIAQNGSTSGRAAKRL